MMVEHHRDRQCRTDDLAGGIEQGAFDVVEAVGGGGAVQQHDHTVERAGAGQSVTDLGVEELEGLPGEAASGLRRAADDGHRFDRRPRSGHGIEVSADRPGRVGAFQHLGAFEDPEAREVRQRGRRRVEAARLLHDLDQSDAHDASPR